MANSSTPPSSNTFSPLPNWECIERGYDATMVHPMTLGLFTAEDGSPTGTRQPVFSMTPADTNTVELDRVQYNAPAECIVTATPTFDAASATSTSVIQASSDIASAFGTSIKFGAGDGDGALFSCSASSVTKKQQTTITGRQSVLTTAHATVGVYQMILKDGAPALAPEFLTALTSVQTIDDVIQNVIPKFGTHYATAVSVGGLAVLSSTFDQSVLSTLTSQNVSLKSDVSGSFAGVSGDAKMSSDNTVSDAYKSVATKVANTISTVGGDDNSPNSISSTWPQSVSSNPTPTAVTLQPLHLLPQLSVATSGVTAQQIDFLKKGIAQYLLSPGNVPLSSSIMNYGDTVVLQPVSGIAPSGLNLVSQPGVQPSGSKAGVQSTVSAPPAARQLSDLSPGGTQLDQKAAGLQLPHITDTSSFLLTLVDPSNASNKAQVDYTQPLCFQVRNSSPALMLDSTAANPGKGLVGLSTNDVSNLSTQWNVTPLYDGTQPAGTENAYATLAHGAPNILVHGDPVSIKRVAPASATFPNSRQGYLMSVNGNLTSGGDYKLSPVSGNSCFFRILLVEKAS
jgi:hypothetical protein